MLFLSRSLCRWFLTFGYLFHLSVFSFFGQNLRPAFPFSLFIKWIRISKLYYSLDSWILSDFAGPQHSFVRYKSLSCLDVIWKWSSLSKLKESVNFGPTIGGIGAVREHSESREVQLPKDENKEQRGRGWRSIKKDVMLCSIIVFDLFFLSVVHPFALSPLFDYYYNLKK